MLYLGRIDNQIKVHGYRVELGEVEAVVRQESGIDGIVAVGWPNISSSARGVEVFLETEGPTRSDLKASVDRRLPTYMAPRRYHYLPRFPLNANGKYDRSALTKYLEGLP
jgi:acyl-CoA synthetase (AMP-forming)/AMP-acid ligase II